LDIHVEKIRVHRMLFMQNRKADEGWIENVNEDITSLGLTLDMTNWLWRSVENIYSYPLPPNGCHQELMMMMLGNIYVCEQLKQTGSET